MPERKNVDKKVPKKNKKKAQQKQKQKQKQSQIVNVNIGSIKRKARRSTSSAPVTQKQIVNPVQYLYQASASPAPLIPPVTESASEPVYELGVSRPVARQNMYDREIYQKRLSFTPEEIVRIRTKLSETSPLTQEAFNSVAGGGTKQKGRPKQEKTEEEKQKAQVAKNEYQRNYRKRLKIKRELERELGVPVASATPIPTKSVNVFSQRKLPDDDYYDDY